MSTSLVCLVATPRRPRLAPPTTTASSLCPRPARNLSNAAMVSVGFMGINLTDTRTEVKRLSSHPVPGTCNGGTCNGEDAEGDGRPQMGA